MKYMLDKDIKKWIYRHFKWWVYEVLYLAKNTETLRKFVVYKSIDKNEIWIRKKEEFMELIDTKNIIPRFKYIWNETYKTY